MPSAIGAQRDVIFALLMRELKARFGNYRLGYFWALLEPVAHVAIFTVIFGARGRQVFGDTSAGVFIMTGIVPFLLFQKTVTRLRNSVSGNRGLLVFRQVRPLDIMVSRALLEGVIFVLTLLMLSSLFIWAGFGDLPHAPLQVIAAALFLYLFSFGLGMCFCAAVTRLSEAEKVLDVIMRPMLIVSAVFYPMILVPPEYRYLLAWNPVVHGIELFREAWIAGFVTPTGSLAYLAGTALLTLFFGFSFYRLTWKQMVAS